MQRSLAAQCGVRRPVDDDAQNPLEAREMNITYYCGAAQTIAPIRQAQFGAAT